MTDRHKTPGLSWHPPGELSAWVREEATRRGVPLSSVLNEAVERLRSESQDRPQDIGSNKDQGDNAGRHGEDPT